MESNLYVEALLRDAILADAVFDSWEAGLISEDIAEIAWLLIALGMP